MGFKLSANFYIGYNKMRNSSDFASFKKDISYINPFHFHFFTFCQREYTLFQIHISKICNNNNDLLSK